MRSQGTPQLIPREKVLKAPREAQTKAALEKAQERARWSQKRVIIVGSNLKWDKIWSPSKSRKNLAILTISISKTSTIDPAKASPSLKWTKSFQALKANILERPSQKWVKKNSRMKLFRKLIRIPWENNKKMGRWCMKMMRKRMRCMTVASSCKPQATIRCLQANHREQPSMF